MEVFDFLKEQFVYILNYMRTTIIFGNLTENPITIMDLTLGLVAVSLFLSFFGFLDDNDDFESEVYGNHRDINDSFFNDIEYDYYVDDTDLY